VVTLLAKLKAVGAWVVRNWKWFLFPLGVLVWLVGKASAKTTVQVRSPEIEGHQALEWELASRTDGKIKELTEKKAADMGIINQNFEQVSKRLDEAEARKAQALQKDPEALTEFLKGVGREQRKPRV
jgi:uncharacterized protein YhaN